MIYLLTWFLGIIPYLDSQNLKIRKFYNLFFLMFIILLFGLRYDVGKDYMSYYERVINSFENINLEAFFKGIYFLSEENIFPLYFLFILSFGITTYLIFKGIKKYSDNEAISFSIYFFGPFFLFSLSGIRQAIAASIFFIAITFILKKKFTYFLITLILTSYFFHFSAIFLIPFYFLKNITFKRCTILIIYIFSLYFMFFGYEQMNYFIKILTDNFDMRYLHYLYSAHGLNEKNISMISFLFRLLKFILILPFINLLNNEKKDKLILNFFFFYLILENIFFHVPIVRRISVYLYFSEFIIFANIYKFIKNKNYKIFYVLLLISIYFLYFSKDVFFNQELNLLPFKIIEFIN